MLSGGCSARRGGGRVPSCWDVLRLFVFPGTKERRGCGGCRAGFRAVPGGGRCVLSPSAPSVLPRAQLLLPARSPLRPRAVPGASGRAPPGQTAAAGAMDAAADCLSPAAQQQVRPGGCGGLGQRGRDSTWWLSDPSLGACAGLALHNH